jgi:Tfp pilus assembly protein PilO
MNREKLKELLALARRHLFSVICSGVALVALVTAALWWMGLEELRSEHEQKSNRNDKMINLRKTGPVLRSELAAVREFTQRLESNLADEDDRSGNDDYFRSMAGRSRAQLRSLQQLSSPPLEEGALYKRVPFSLSVTGTYPQVQAFLHAVETGPRLANLTAFSMLRLTANSADVSLEIDVELIGKK